MVDAVEVAIESALLDRFNAFMFSSPDSICRASPNVVPIIPTPAATFGNWWVRASFLPADSFALGIDYGSDNQHYGIFQVDVLYSQNSGELAPGRIAADVMAWFKRGTKLQKGGFKVEIFKTPYRSGMMKEDPWVKIPVSIPYLAFASNPA